MAVSKDTSNETESEFPTQFDSLPALSYPTVIPSSWASLLFSATAETTRLVGAEPLALPSHGSWPTDLNTAAVDLAKVHTLKYNLTGLYEQSTHVSDRYSRYAASATFGNWGAWQEPPPIELPEGMFTLTDSTGANPHAQFFVFVTFQDENDYGGDFTGGAYHTNNDYNQLAYWQALPRVRFVFGGAGGLISAVEIDSMAFELDATYGVDYWPPEYLGEKLFVYVTLMELPFS
jgi:hypothetical protein